MARTKHLAMRPVNNVSYKGQTIETVVPDMGSEIMMQQKQHTYPTYVPTEHPSTSQQAAAGALNNKLKRRLQLPYMDQRAGKIMKTHAHAQPMKNYDINDFYRDQMDDEIEVRNEADPSSMMGSIKQMQQKQFVHQQKPSMQQQKQFQQQQKQFQQQQKQFEKFQKKAQKKQDDENFDAALKDLGKTMRLVQREILDDFFEKQMNMAQQEHEFQAKQDKLLMQAFEEQTQLIMKSAQTLLGIELPGFNKTPDAKVEEKTEAEVHKQVEAQNLDEKKISHDEDAAEEDEEDTESYMNPQDQEDHDEDDEDEEAESEDEADGENEHEEEDQDEADMEQNDLAAQHGDYLDENNEEEEENDDEEQDEEQADEEDEYEDDDQMENLITDPIELVSSELVED